MASDLWGVLTRGETGVTVRFERRYATSPEDLWSCVTDPERLARWLGPVYGDLVVGGRFELRMGDDVPGAPENAVGDILECDAPSRLVLGWEFPGEDRSRVVVDIHADGDGALLLLEHLDLQEAGARGYGGGWHASLDQLDDHVAGRPVRAWDDLFAAALPRYREA